MYYLFNVNIVLFYPVLFCNHWIIGSTDEVYFYHYQLTNFNLFLHVYFPYTPVMFSNQTDPTGKFMNHVIAHCVISQVRYMVSWHMIFEVVACLLYRIYILVLFPNSWACYNCQFRTWIFLGFMNNTQGFVGTVRNDDSNILWTWRWCRYIRRCNREY